MNQPYQTATHPKPGAGHGPEHTRGTGHCLACGPSLRNCVLCGGKFTVHRILSTHEPWCEVCGNGRRLIAKRRQIAADDVRGRVPVAHGRRHRGPR